ncbi:anaerobic coproporphyrinogen III oxidase [Hypnocyclicus thermotrophus]|uniref:Anaerobic coproporphyrinogen III oxidase n=1 Tax=Hypnocyclicus thermotrophus TaxID=1627895 RepID=A0AA46DYL4_9FUSO|nr:radical SAM protein [Hypnocyclicus thermotrophus]TDT70437.1 anaerobic coproporphyrinogen III oxidase [Hypnocyclicus thermotrophus]
MKHYNIPIFIAHYGCPNTCTFCNQNKITGVITNITPNEVKKIIDEYLETLPENSNKEVAFFGGTFTALPLNIQEEFLKIVKSYIDLGVVNGIRLSTRPDCIDDKILSLLKKYNVTTIELGVQSLDNEVLSLSERGYKEEIVYYASELIKKYNIILGIQIMPGLNGSNFNSDLETIKKVVKIKPDIVRIYPTLVINKTKLEILYKRGEFTPLSLNEAIKISALAIAYFELNNIKIIRVGLQPSDDLREDGVIIAGPFHPAFKELVEGKIISLFFDKILSKNKINIIETNPRNMSRVVGINKVNKIKYFNILKIIQNKDINIFEYKINNTIYKREEILKNIIKTWDDGR